MLPAQSRLRQSADFRQTVRRGVRAASTTLVVHARPIDSPPSRVGFVVSKAVGNAVTRNRVKRRLRHLVIPLLEGSPQMHVVVRALPGAASEPQRVPEDLARAWSRACGRIGDAGAPGQDRP